MNEENETEVNPSAVLKKKKRRYGIRCEHKTRVKAGRTIYGGKQYQQYLCKSCLHRFVGEEIRKRKRTSERISVEDIDKWNIHEENTSTI